MISDIRYREVLERWQFDIVTDPEVQQAGAGLVFFSVDIIKFEYLGIVP